MNIIDIADGEIINAPGVYRISMAWYHSQCCAGPSVSSSGLRKIYNESPYAFWWQSEFNPDRPEKTESPALALGKAAHALILGEDHFDSMFAFLPEDAPRRPTATQVAAFERDGEWSKAAAAGADFWTKWDEANAGKTIITGDMVRKIRRMAANINDNPAAVEVLRGSLTELCLIWQDEQTGVWLKSRIDHIPDNGADYADLTTFAPQTKELKRAVHRAITDNDYPMQMGLAQIGSRIVLGTEATDCVLVMAQSTEPHCVLPIRLDEEVLYWARTRVRSAINTFAECLKADHWPQPVEGLMEYTIPPSLTEKFEEMQRNGELPSME